MDARAVQAALAPQTLAPPIAEALALPLEAVQATLELLAAGAQPVFIARYRPERVGGLGLRELERVQAAAARAAAFEFQRQALMVELEQRRMLAALEGDIARATHPLDLDDVRIGLRKRKRGPAAKAREGGLQPLADALVATGTTGPLARAAASAAARRDRRGPRPQRSAGAAGPSESAATSEHESPADESLAAIDAQTLEEAHAPIESEGRPADAIDAAPADSTPHGEDEGEHDEGEHDESEQDESEHDESEQDESEQDESEQDEGEQDESEQDEGEHGDPEHDPNAAASAPAPERAGDPHAAADPSDPLSLARAAVGEGALSPEAALAGARTICAERIAELPHLRASLRGLLVEHGRLVATIADAKKDKSGRYAKLAARTEGCATVSATTLLAVARGEREGALALEIEIDPERVAALAAEILGIADNPCGEQVALSVQEAWTHALGKAARAGAWRLMKERADRGAIAEYCETLRPLLLAPPLGPWPVLAIDPGFEPGCRVVVIGDTGAVVASDTLYPLQPRLQAPQSKARLAELIREHGVRGIAIVGAGGGRDVERLCRELVRESEASEAGPIDLSIPGQPGSVAIVLVDADATGLLAASRASKGELGDDSPLRRAVAIARRVQDPLGELAKIDPRKLGLGQFQHEVDQEELRAALEQVISSTVSDVGVDVNTAAPDRLARVAGLSQALARAVATHREQHGPFRTRSGFFDVPGFVGKVFEQGAGFLRIKGGEQPVDATAIHPERYGLVTQMARDLGVTVGDLLGNTELVDRIEAGKYVGVPGAIGEPAGAATIDRVLAELRAPGRDVRPPFVATAFHPDLGSFEDLQVGMELPGVITRLATFGAFVDVGIAQEGLVHVSELAHEFVSRPAEAVHVGQTVRGRVIEIDAERKRFSLSLRALLPRPERPPRPERRDRDRDRKRGDDDRRRHPAEGEGARAEGEGRGRGKGEGRGKGDKKGRDRDRRGRDDRPPKQDRVLGFHMDLSAIAARLEKD